MARQILVLNGPNLNLLGTREPDVYGADTLDDILAELRAGVAGRDVELRDAQSNSEGELIDALHDARTWADGVVFNPGAYTHTSIALRDAISACELPVAREEFRHTSMLSAVCLGVVGGFGKHSYSIALDGLLAYLNSLGSIGVDDE
jgi:3-dehydroquinate dehydratase-2